jgi:protein TonB
MREFIVAAFLLFTLSSTAQTGSPEKIYSFVEQMPEFPGGDAEMMKFLMKNILYPKVTSESLICGSLKVQFVIDKDGSVINPRITKSCGSEWDAELLRVIKLFPKFKPGYQNGKAVRVYFNLPIACLKPQ